MRTHRSGTDEPAIDVTPPVVLPPCRMERPGVRRLIDEEQVMRRQAWGGGMLVGLALLIATLVGFVTAVQASERETAEQLLAETLAPLIEIDALLDRELAGMVERAREPDTTAVIAPNFPLAVSLPAALVAGGTRAEVRAQMLEAGAALVYAQGTSAFRREPGSGGGAPFSVQGAIRFGLERLTAGTHSTARAALIALAVVTAVVLGLTLAQAAEGTRLRRAGLALILGGVVVLVAGGWGADLAGRRERRGRCGVGGVAVIGARCIGDGAA